MIMEKTKVVAIIQAHMSSSRLPNKIMLDLCGMPALYRMIERIRQAKNIDQIVVATSTMACDDVLIDACKEWGVDTFRGSDHDVLERYWGATQAYPAGTYIRLTADEPLMDPAYLDKKIQFFWDNDYRYVTGNEQELAGTMHCEVFTAELMQETYENATEGYEHEHVTPYMYTRQDSWFAVPSRYDGLNYRLELDTPEDYEVLKAVYEALYQPGNRFNTKQIVEFLEAHPEIASINSEIVQKHFTECSYDSFEG